MKRNIALKLMYNGTAYHGWQVQKRDVTVAGTLEKALSGLAGERIHLVGAGRTDAGVHAEHYIANFRTTMTKVCANGFLYNMVRAIAGTVLYAAEGKLLPEDIPQILDSGNRTLAGPTVPPGGLYLTRLWYEDERLNG